MPATSGTRSCAGQLRLSGGEGTDVLNGGELNSTLIGGPGQDWFIGGEGMDYVSYNDGDPRPVHADLDDGFGDDGRAGEGDIRPVRPTLWYLR